jgi:predicted DNA repair protein MutK
MPSGGLLALLDDITAVLDDVSVMTKVAASKTAGVLGDDLALNAEQVAGVRAERELPVVWAVAKGSALNKMILVPAALTISALAPWAVVPLLMAGGVYLCFEGAEKLAHKTQMPDRPAATTKSRAAAAAEPQPPAGSHEREKIRGAIRTDFILSAEIITITLGTVAGAALMTQVTVLAAIAVIMTVGVYGLVAAIVRLDDIGRFLVMQQGTDQIARLLRALGRFIVNFTPYLMRILSVVGTAAMFLVGGGILTHGIPGLHAWLHHHLVEPVAGLPVFGGSLAWTMGLLGDAGIGIAAGAATLGIVMAAQKAFGRTGARKSQ